VDERSLKGEEEKEKKETVFLSILCDIRERERE